MADEIKPTTPGSTNPPPSSSSPSGLTSLKPSGPPPPPKPSGPSPLTPDIKIPPNLPTGEVKPPVFPKPPVPSSSFQASQPLKPPPLSPPPISRPPLMPSAPVTEVKPPIPPPLTSQPGQPPTVFKSSIRTMQDDLAALKKGQLPAGFKIEKESEKEVKTSLQTAPSKITSTPPISHVELGKLEKAKPITYDAQNGQEAQKPATPFSPQVGLSKPSIDIPSAAGILAKFGGLGSKKLLGAIVGLVIMAGIVTGFIILREPETPPKATATPTITARVPTATPAPLEAILPVSDPVRFSLNQDMTGKFASYIQINRLLPAGEPQIYRITDLNGKQYGFSEYTDGLNIEAPNELKALVEDGSLFITVFSKSDQKASFGFIVKLKNTNQINGAASVLKNWESTMTQSLSNPFLFDQNKAVFIGFLDNTYNGVAIRYRNFPDVNSTIDYAVFKAKNGESYLVMVNSREHIYEIIDKLK